MKRNAWWAVLPVCGLLAHAAHGALLDDFGETESGGLEMLSSVNVGVADELDESGLSDTHVATTTRLTRVTATTLELVGLDQVQAVISPVAGVLDYASTSGASGMLLLDYTVPGGGTAIDLTNDLSLLVEFLQFDPGDVGGLPVTAQISDGTFTRSLTKSLTVAGAQPLYFPLGEFAGDAGIDLASIENVRFEFEAVDGYGADFRIREISSEDFIPEPSALALLAIGAAAVLRRRG